MFVEIIVAVCVAFAAAGLAILAARIARRRLPTLGILGIAAGAVIVSLTWLRYGWAERVRAALPPEVRIVRELRSQSVFEPWTFIAPRVSGLVAIDDSRTMRHPSQPGVLIVSLIHAERHAETLSLRVLVDCPRSRYALLEGPPEIGNALPEHASWQTGAEGNDLLAASCGTAGKAPSR